MSHPHQPPPYGVWHAPPAPRRPTNGSAVAALVLNATPCGLVVPGVICAIIGLVQIRRDGSKGRWAAITALVLAPVWIGVVALSAWGLVLLGQSIERPLDLEAGECFVSDDIDDGEEEIRTVDVVSCARSHHGEVVATFDAARDQLSTLRGDSASSACLDAVDDQSKKRRLLTGDLLLIPLAENPDDVEVDDPIVCFVQSSDGSRTKGSYFDEDYTTDNGRSV